MYSLSEIKDKANTVIYKGIYREKYFAIEIVKSHFYLTYQLLEGDLDEREARLLAEEIFETM